MMHKGIDRDHSPVSRLDRPQAVIIILEAAHAECSSSNPTESTTARRIKKLLGKVVLAVNLGIARQGKPRRQADPRPAQVIGPVTLSGEDAIKTP
jgi:hypothetical protein